MKICIWNCCTVSYICNLWLFEVFCMSYQLYILQRGSMVFWLGIHLVVELCVFIPEEYLAHFIKERIKCFPELCLCCFHRRKSFFTRIFEVWFLKTKVIRNYSIIYISRYIINILIRFYVFHPGNQIVHYSSYSSSAEHLLFCHIYCIW